MQLRQIQLHHFRNYASLHLTIPSGLCIFVGKNAQGKTNLLEAIYLLSLGRSFRTTDDKDLILSGEESTRVRAEVDRQAGQVSVQIDLRRRGPKSVHIGGERLKRVADLVGIVNAVVFSPDDLQLLKGSPGKRRAFIDAEIAQISALYRHHFLRYQRVLKQRNNVLKAIRAREAPKTATEPWDGQLIHDAVYVIVKRAETIRRLSGWAQEAHASLTGGAEKLEVSYRPFFAREDEIQNELWEDDGFVRQRLADELQKRREDEYAAGITLIGPQRDDIAFMIGGMDGRSFASQGQQRSAVLATKLAELELFKEDTGEYPLLLLDDVMSELDDHRREYFLRSVTGKVNTFITTTNVRSFKEDILDKAAVFTIHAGTIRLTKSP